MTNTVWSDVSEFQKPVNDSYPYRFLSIRSNDGTYRDRNFPANYAWSKNAANTGKLDGFIVYFVWQVNWQNTINVLKSMIGTPHPKMAIMLDIESWSGKIKGNQSAGINAAREQIISWLGGNRKRVIGYGNRYDLDTLWPTKGDAKLVVASYGSIPNYSNRLGHQFADNYAVAPFGPCDGNIAYDLSPSQLAAYLGLPSSSESSAGSGTLLKLEDDDMSAQDVAAINAHTDEVARSILYGDGKNVTANSHPDNIAQLRSDLADLKAVVDSIRYGDGRTVPTGSDTHPENLKVINDKLNTLLNK